MPVGWPLSACPRLSSTAVAARPIARSPAPASARAPSATRPRSPRIREGPTVRNRDINRVNERTKGAPMPPAARVSDTHTCTMIDPGPKPHMVGPVGGPIKPPCSTTVETDHLGQARATDQLQCLTPPPNFIVTGSTSVDVDGLMAARQTDKTMHPPPG